MIGWNKDQAASEFDVYSNKYECARMERREGILQITLTTNSDSLRWSFLAHKELPDVFLKVGADDENRVIILTGCGDEFIGPRVLAGPHPLMAARQTAESAHRLISEAKQLLMNFLNINVPIIAAVNGPAWRHSELALLADVVLASDTAKFQDSGHFQAGQVPGDGMHIVYPLLLGWNRARYFLLTSKVLSASEALDLGLVSEVLSQEHLLARAWTLARQFAAQPLTQLRLTRAVLVERLKREMQEMLGFGLYAQFLALMDNSREPIER